MITVRLHGPFKDFHEGPIQVSAGNALEAIRAVTSQIPGFKPDARLGMKQVQVAGLETMEQYLEPLESGSTIDLIPNLFLSGGPRTQIIVGTVLIVTALLMGGVFWPAIIGSMGASLVLGGVMQLIAPQQKLSANEEERSRYLGSPPNTVAIGTPIPILLGEDLVQGHILSSDVDAAEVA